VNPSAPSAKERAGFRQSVATRLLATTSFMALMAAAAVPTPARAGACSTTLGPGNVTACTNAGTLPSITVTDAVASSINNTGTISPGGISLINSQLFGAIEDTGTIAGGITLDAHSTIAAAPSGINIDGTSTFGGGIVNAGLIEPGGGVSNGILVGHSVVSTFTGGITNTGTITVGDVTGQDGIQIDHVVTFIGNVSNSGTISGKETAIALQGNALNSLFSGSIVNSGTLIGVADDAISISAVSTFAGGVTNAGLITAAKTGILVTQVSTFTGGISNAGTGVLSAGKTGIVVNSISSFGGSINNGGSLTASTGPGIVVTKVSLFAGGVVNGGSIVAAKTGIVVGSANNSANNITSFLGGITNSGTITAGALGILLAGGAPGAMVSSFGGGIVNTGRIHATSTGILAKNVSNFSGGIVNSGTISFGAGAGVIIAFGIDVENVSTFAGGITNNGTITAPVGLGIVVVPHRTEPCFRSSPAES
jgi:hypothetical protein